MSPKNDFTSQEESPTFKNLEQSGWDAKAKHYDEFAGEITKEAAQSMIEVAGVKAGNRLLDVACGTGSVAGLALEQGLTVTGVDFAPTMLVEARNKFPDAEFYEGDAEALQFESNTFDAVTCAFGILHLADPDKAIHEAFRALQVGGKYVFMVWSSPESHEYFKLVLNAVEEHGTMDVALPPAPPIFRFSEHKECESALSSAGFTEVKATTLSLVWEPRSANDLLDLLNKSSVRIAMLLELQEPAALKKINKTILEGAAQFKKGDKFQIAWPAVMASGMKPL